MSSGFREQLRERTTNLKYIVIVIITGKEVNTTSLNIFKIFSASMYLHYKRTGTLPIIIITK